MTGNSCRKQVCDPDYCHSKTVTTFNHRPPGGQGVQVCKRISVLSAHVLNMRAKHVHRYAGSASPRCTHNGFVCRRFACLHVFSWVYFFGMGAWRRPVWEWTHNGKEKPTRKRECVHKRPLRSKGA